MRKLSHSELQIRQSSVQASAEKTPLRVVLNNIRSLYNVGSIFRTADGIGIEKLCLCGITPIPPDTQITKTALGAEKVVPWKFYKTAAEAIKAASADGFEIVLLEQTVKSIPYQNFEPIRPVCLVLGNEVAGVSDELVSLAERSVEIEMVGLKNSLNVAVAFGIVGYQFRSKLITQRSKLQMKTEL